MNTTALEIHSLMSFPSPADDDSAKSPDLNELLVKHPAATFFMRVSGSSMHHAGIHDKDILVVDRSVEPVHGKIVVAALEGRLTLKKLKIHSGAVCLIEEKEGSQPLRVDPEKGIYIWGVVIHAIRSL